MRAKGIGVFQLTAGCAGFDSSFDAPVALNKVGAPAQVYQLLLPPDVHWLLVLRLLYHLGPV